MAIVRRRLIIWLIKAYIKKWGLTIAVFFVLGIGAFFLLKTFLPTILAKLPTTNKVIIGVVGAYTLDNLPDSILHQVSQGLTKISPAEIPEPDLAEKWEIQDSGKTYIFHLKKNIKFQDGTPFDASFVNYNFADVTIEKPDPYTVVFKLKDEYSPFLLTVSRPLFRNGIIGTGQYKINDIKLNGPFIQSLALSDKSNSYSTKTYIFYPTVISQKTAYVLGEITQALALPTLDFENYSFKNFPTATITKNINYTKMVAIFYNTKDPVLSDSKIRNALSYAIPDTFEEGQRTYTLYPSTSWAFQDVSDERKQDFTHAKLLLTNAGLKNTRVLHLKTLPKYEKVAQQIVKEWKKVGVTAKVETVNARPQNFQMFLGEYTVSADPDQYTLWHSGQDNNITRYSSQRIDKLIEDGRKIVDIQQRQKIYADFQKYLLPDAPATFLYFPYEYTVSR